MNFLPGVSDGNRLLRDETQPEPSRTQRSGWAQPVGAADPVCFTLVASPSPLYSDHGFPFRRDPAGTELARSEQILPGFHCWQ